MVPMSQAEIWSTLAPAAQQYISDTWGFYGIGQGPGGTSAPAIPIVFSFEHYYSRVRLAPDTITVDGSNNVTYTFLAGHAVNPFQYGQGGSMVPAGFPSSFVGTYDDTNLQLGNGRQTNDSALVVIQGLGINVDPRSDIEMLRQIQNEMYLTSGFGSQLSIYKHGLPSFNPGGGALFGGGRTQGLVPSTSDTTCLVPGFPANGWPSDGNYYTVDDQICWYPQSASRNESNFGMVLTVGRQVQYTASARAAGIFATGGAAGSIPAVLPPSTAGAEGTYVDLMVKLRAVSIKPRNTNQ
jgi:hypothetical protein